MPARTPSVPRLAPAPSRAGTALRWRARTAFADPLRALLTLESFARTEEEGGLDIAAAARAATDDSVAGHLRRHAEDERRHAELFRARAARLRAELAAAGEGEATREIAAGVAPHALHGHSSAQLRDEDDLLRYVARLHVAERRAEALFARLRRVADEETRAILDEILRDEKYHVAYTGTLLDRWRREGRADEVERALSAARGSRLWGAWKRAGARAGAHFGRTVLGVLYLTLVAPAAPFARRALPRGGWAAPRPSARDARDEPRSQY